MNGVNNDEIENWERKLPDQICFLRSSSRRRGRTGSAPKTTKIRHRRIRDSSRHTLGDIPFDFRVALKKYHQTTHQVLSLVYRDSMMR